MRMGVGDARNGGEPRRTESNPTAPCFRDYARRRCFLAGANIESSGNSASWRRLADSSHLPPIPVNTTIPPTPIRALFKNPLLETPCAPSFRLPIPQNHSACVLLHTKAL